MSTEVRNPLDHADYLFWFQSAQTSSFTVVIRASRVVVATGAQLDLKPVKWCCAKGLPIV